MTNAPNLTTDLAWIHGAYCRPDRSVGEQCAHLEDFTVDEDRSDPAALEAYYSLSRAEQREIEREAHERALRDL